MMRFGDRVVVVTGAASGIGRAAALAFAAEGAVVVAVDRDAAGLAGTAALGDAQARIETEVGDLSLGDDVRAMVSGVIARHGRIDIAYLNAGIQGPVGSILALDEDDFDSVMAANTRSVFLGLRHILPAMAERGAGAIVITCSVAALGGMANLAAYVASKHAALGLMRAAAMDVAALGVRVNAVCPGAVGTPMLEGVLAGIPADGRAAAAERFAQSSPIGRIADSDQVVAAVLFLASDAASAITGTHLTVDGGLATRIGSATRSSVSEKSSRPSVDNTT